MAYRLSAAGLDAVARYDVPIQQIEAAINAEIAAGKLADISDPSTGQYEVLHLFDGYVLVRVYGEQHSELYFIPKDRGDQAQVIAVASALNALDRQLQNALN